MRTRILGLVAAIASLVLAPSASAQEIPHNQAWSSKVCDNCHNMFVQTPSGKADFSPGCTACHNNLANPSPRRGFPWAAGVHDALPGEHGNQHNWSGYGVNKKFGAGGSGLGKLVDGKLTCVTCHNIHPDPRPQYKAGSLHTSIPLNVAQTLPAPATGQMTLTAVGAVPNAWRLKIQTTAAGGGTFVLSHDWTLSTPTWFKWDGGAWVAGTGAPTDPGKPYVDNTEVTLDDNASKVKFVTAAVGDYWDFTVSFPALRASNESDAICYECHAERAMSHVRVGGDDATYLPNGSRLFSHPVNVALRENGDTYDRVEADVLDADGSKQSVSSGDGNVADDLVLDAGKVRCTTCHAVHNGNSNSLSY